MNRVVFDIGGTSSRITFAHDMDLGEIEKFATPPKPRAILDIIDDFIKRTVFQEPVEEIVGAIAGVISPEGTVLASPNLPQWEGFALAEAIHTRFNVRSAVGNDAELEGLAEAFFGAGRGFTIVAYLTAGTGVGGARIVAGALDHRSVGFEPGHQIIDVTSGLTLEARVGGATLIKTHGVSPLELPRAVWDELTPVFAAGIWNAIVLWSPDVVVLGGSLMNETNGFRVADLTRAVERYRRVIPTVPPIFAATLGDEAGLRGALMLASSHKGR